MQHPSADFAQVWSPPGPLIGMVHVGPLPTASRVGPALADLAARARGDALALRQAGFDAIIVENMHDTPYVHGAQDPAVVASMTVLAATVREAAPNLPLGVQILSGGNREALAVAAAIGADFIRCENFAYAHVADEGLLERAEAGPLLRYRRWIGADAVAVLADVKKKHASHALTADLDVGEACRGARFCGADAVVVTGVATGRSAALADVASARGSVDCPVLVGSGCTPENAADLLEHAHALIVGSWIKQGGDWRRSVDAERASRMVRAVRGQ